MSGAPDVDTITGLLHQHLDPAARCTGISRAPSGNSQETWFLDIDGSDETSSLVLRRSAAGGTLEWSDRGIEVAVLGAVHAAGLPVPLVRWWEPDGGSLDRAYAVLDRAPGSNPDVRNVAVGTVVETELGRLLAALHRQADPPLALERPTATVDATLAQLDFWTHRARTNPVTPPITAALCGWLASNVPDDDAESVLLWGDPGPHNVLTDESGSITALLDWELAHVGHPLSDLGAARWSCLGDLDRERMTAAYEIHAGYQIDRDTLAWFEVLACVSRSVMLFDGVQAVLDGRSRDMNLLGLGTALVSANMLIAAEIAWGIGPDDVTQVMSARAAALHPTPEERAHAIAQFLTKDVLGAVSDARVRRSVKVAAALLTAGDRKTGEPPLDAWAAFDVDATGTTTAESRRRLVADVIAARATQRSILDLYGAAVALRFDRPETGPKQT